MRSRPRKLRRPPPRGQARAVVDETIALFHRLLWVAEQIYGAAGRSTARRGILRGLARYGPQTVPTLARARFVSRQHVQTVVDALAAERLVARRDNPRHARSRLVVITERGLGLVRAMDEIDARVLASATGGIDARDLEVTARTLKAVRNGLELSARWRAAIPRP